MRIAMISTPFVTVPPPGYGGTELVVYELVEGLTANGHDVTLFATGDSFTSGRLRYLYATAQWPPGPLTDVNHVSWAMREIAQGRFDLIHAHSATALAFARLLTDTPLIYTLHHVQEQELSNFYRDFQEPWYVAISKDQARREIPLERMQVVHHGLDPNSYLYTSTPADYVCFVGRFTPVKGVHTAIDVAAAAGTPIRVAGEIHPVDREYGETEVRPRLNHPHVTFLGPVGPERKVPLLRDARALLAPIEWSEPFGLILIEAMLSGCPVVAFPRGSVPELVEPGLTGFIARDREDMARLIAPGGPIDEIDRLRCRERAVERFSRSRMVADYERLYRRVLADSTLTTGALEIVAEMPPSSRWGERSVAE